MEVILSWCLMSIPIFKEKGWKLSLWNKLIRVLKESSWFYILLYSGHGDSVPAPAYYEFMYIPILARFFSCVGSEKKAFLLLVTCFWALTGAISAKKIGRPDGWNCPKTRQVLIDVSILSWKPVSGALWAPTLESKSLLSSELDFILTLTLFLLNLKAVFPPHSTSSTDLYLDTGREMQCLLRRQPALRWDSLCWWRVLLMCKIKIPYPAALYFCNMIPRDRGWPSGKQSSPSIWEGFGDEREKGEVWEAVVWDWRK